MSNTKESEFLARLRAATGRKSSAPPADRPALDDATLRILAPGEDLVACFLTRARAAGADARSCPRRESLATLAIWLEAWGVKSLALGPGLDADTADHLRAAGIEVAEPPHGAERLYSVEAALALAQAGIAETGTLLQDAGEGRLLTLAPPQQFVVLEASRIVVDFAEAWEANPGDSSARVLVTGPSKTADIEGVLITGVHGPARLGILVTY